MPINQNDKLAILADILKNQTEEQFLTKREREQISQLTTSLLNETAMEADIFDTIAEIKEHHENNREFDKNISKWLANLIKK